MKLSEIIKIALVCVLCPMCFSDIIVLKEGQTLTGDILAEKETHLYIDIGIDVLAVPKEKILQYEYDDKETADINFPPQSYLEDSLIQTDKLYSTSIRKETTIEECVKNVSEAVVKVTTPAGMGSGFFLNEDGYLITNFHVIEKETKIDVTVFQKQKNGFGKKKFKKVKIIAINPFVDLALLKVEDLEELKVKFVPLADISKIKSGQQVFAIGNPLGLERTVTDGVVSSTNRAFEGNIYIQTNADINPGNSGGPLFNLAGQVVGVTNMGYIFFGGLGFAIPIDSVKRFIENRDAFAYDKDNPNTGFRYLQPVKRLNKNKPEFLTNKPKRK